MTDDEFWDIIDQARVDAGNDDDKIAGAMQALLRARPAEDILAFQRCFNQHYFASYRSDLWGAAYLMNGGCSDDGFDYFRAWLISQGRAVFEAALRVPDSLAAHVAGIGEHDFGFENEDVLGVALHAWRDKHGLPADAYEEFYAAIGPVGGYPALSSFAWSDDNGGMDEEAGRRLYPKLSARFG